MMLVSFVTWSGALDISGFFYHVMQYH